MNKHENWDEFEPCPNCGNNHLTVEYVGADVFQVNDSGTVDAVEKTDTHDVQRVECVECDTLLEGPAATLEIPTSEDVPHVLEMIENTYDTVQIQYEGMEDPPSYVMRLGSLCQELLAQLSNQGFSRYD